MKLASDRNTIDAFEPKRDGPLLPQSELDGLSEVDEDAIDAAIEAWRESPPDDIFKALLEAESDG